MATVLDHGTALEHRVHMHPFFSNAKPDHPVAQSAHAVTIESDRITEEHGAETLQGSNTGYNFTTNCRDLRPQSMSVPAEIRIGGPWSVSGDDLEHENSRVKRRRISVEPTKSPTGPTNASTVEVAWHEQLQDAAGTLEESHGAGLESERLMFHYTQTMEEKISQAASRSAREIQPPLPSSAIRVEIDPFQPFPHQLISTDGAMDDPPLKRTKASATPKKKVLNSDHGKLTFPPKTSPRRSPRSAKVQQNSESNGTKNKTRSSRKVEIKNGKLVSAMRVSLPYSAPESGARIDEILSGQASNCSTGDPQAEAAVASVRPAVAKVTHPFFLGKATVKVQNQQADLKSEPSSVVISSDDETNSKPNSKAPKAWKDIVFGSGKLARQIAASLPPAWPPLALQHIHPSVDLHPPVSFRALAQRNPSKLKQYALHLRTEEDILWNFSLALKPDRGPSTIRIPDRSVMSGKELLKMVSSRLETESTKRSPPHSTGPLKARIESTLSCFDRGMAAGPQMWAHEYAPTCWQDVLESRSKVLHDWLTNLQVHQVQNSKSQTVKPSVLKKGRRKRKTEDMDDFIAQSDDDDVRSTASGKNAILLVGPPGSGKTASVFAVAQQLDFEVFEIHPGMRRSGRDIEDKVGDMTRNHLVQPSSSLSRDSSVFVDDGAVLTHGPLPANQKTMAGFMAKRGKHSRVTETQDVKIAPTTSQKQSLILFEEVDILFEEDKGFWTQVQYLNRTSKRPLILTCNDTGSIPLDDLDLFTVLHYTRPEPEVAVQHLGHLAAVEGHLLHKEALENLYLTKGQDLRSAITELNLWCQMTVGSQQGGLDWMLPYDEKWKLNPDASVTRIVSQDTYTSGLDLLPGRFEDVEDMIRFAQDSLGIDPLDWVKDEICSDIDTATRLTSLNDTLTLSDAKSALDLFDDSTAAILAGTIRRLPMPTTITRSAPRDEVVNLYLNNLTSGCPARTTISSLFEPLLEESRIGLPTAPGRKAASLDNPSSLPIITEIAPYIRSIVSHDRCLEELRSELHGSSLNRPGANKRQRRTRAARAAMEGGSKGTTRRDKWFPDTLDWAAVLGTGNGWPMFRDDDTDVRLRDDGRDSMTQSPACTPPSSMATEPEIEV